MLVCEQWLRNDFLVRHEPGDICSHEDCPPLRRGTPPTEEYRRVREQLKERTERESPDV